MAAILVTNPTSVVAKVSPSPKVRLRLEKAISICCLIPRASGAGFVGNQHDPQLGQLLLKLAAAVGQVPKQLPRYLLSEIRLGQQLFGQG